MPSQVSVEDAVQLKDLWFHYRQGQYALRGIDLGVKGGSATIMVGPNGSGKTTLLKVVNGLLTPKRGLVNVLGVRLHDGNSVQAVRNRIGYIPQQLGLVRSSTAMENVMVGALSRTDLLGSLLKQFDRDDLRLARDCLDMVELGSKAHEKVFRLSGGERQRVAIARALMQKPALILADEFTSDLDYVTEQKIMDFISDIRRLGVTVLMAMHNLQRAAEYGEKIVVLNRGCKVAELTAGELTHERVAEIFRNGR